MGIPWNGGKKLQHGAIDVAVTDNVKVLLPANPKRLRVQMYDSGVSGSVVYVGDAKDVDGNDLSEDNGWPLREERVVLYNPNDSDHYFKFLANMLELFTKDAIYGRAYTADGTVRFIEELET